MKRWPACPMCALVTRDAPATPTPVEAIEVRDEARREIRRHELDVVMREDEDFAGGPFRRTVVALGQRARVVDADDLERIPGEALLEALAHRGEARRIDRADEDRDARHAGRARAAAGTPTPRDPAGGVPTPAAFAGRRAAPRAIRAARRRARRQARPRGPARPDRAARVGRRAPRRRRCGARRSAGRQTRLARTPRAARPCACTTSATCRATHPPARG